MTWRRSRKNAKQIRELHRLREKLSRAEDQVIAQLAAGSAVSW